MRNRVGLVYAVLVLMALSLIPEVSEASIGMVKAKSGVLIEVNSGRTLWEQNSDESIPPASITKILSLYILHEAIEAGRVHPTDLVDISLRAAETGGARMFLKVGTRVTLDEVMKGMAVASGNDACVAAAEHLSGSVEEFVNEMNQKARALGMTNSTFVNPNGLPAKGQLTSARDIAKLSLAYLKRFPSALELHSMKYYTYNSVVLRNRNKLLWSCPGTDGIKTGWVVASGYNLSATAKRGDTRLLAVVLGAPNPRARLCETARILEEGFAMETANDPGISAVPTTDLASLGGGSVTSKPAHASRSIHHRAVRGKRAGGVRIAAVRESSGHSRAAVQGIKNKISSTSAKGHREASAQKVRTVVVSTKAAKISAVSSHDHSGKTVRHKKKEADDD